MGSRRSSIGWWILGEPCKCDGVIACERNRCGWLVENNRRLEDWVRELNADQDLEAIKERLRRER